MLLCNKKNVIILSLILSIIILFGIHFILIDVDNKKSTQNNLQSQVTLKISKQKLKTNNYESLFIYQKTSNWRIKIPRINLDAAIQEGTSTATMRQAVAHFENTSKWNGNVCLAAHNRGYKYNFFALIKNLKKGDIIIYKLGDEERVYEVEKNMLIPETEWSYLEKSNDNKITLITCVENKPEYRICVQSKEI